MGWGEFKKCTDKRPCFARNQFGKCRILTHVYPNGECPYCKDTIDMTNGRRYPFDPNYNLTYEGKMKSRA